jgi:hypothetical protein
VSVQSRRHELLVVRAFWLGHLFACDDKAPTCYL